MFFKGLSSVVVAKGNVRVGEALGEKCPTICSETASTLTAVWIRRGLFQPNACPLALFPEHLVWKRNGRDCFLSHHISPTVGAE